MRRSIALVAALAATAAAAFEKPAELPGWFMSGGGRAEYAAVKDGQVKHGGRFSARLEPVKGDTSTYGTLMQSFGARRYIGKRLRLSAFIRTAGAHGRVDFWARVQAANSPGDGPGLGGGSHWLPTHSEWTRYDLVFDVPAEAAAIQFGVGLSGFGKVWIDDVSLVEVDRSTPLDDGTPAVPVNLDFER